MKSNNMTISFVALAVLVSLGLLRAPRVFAHCDGLDGPVVKAAQNALETGNVNLVLIWVQKKDEADIKKAFQKTLAVRNMGAGAKELADMYFFETLVRTHREAEGAPYTGLKPTGRDLGPAIPAADKALASGSVEPLLKLLIDAARDGTREQFKEVSAKRKFSKDEVDAGREYVKAYVEFVHYVEHLYEAAKSPAGDHFPEVKYTEGSKSG